MNSKQLINNFQQNRKVREQFMNNYKLQHQLCPKCGSNEYSTTLMACIFNSERPQNYKDNNTCTCLKCGDRHFTYERRAGYLSICPKGHFARNCCEYTTDDSLPDIPYNVLLDFIGCRNCQFFTGEIRTFKINIQNVKNQNDFMQNFINDIKGVSLRYSINKQNIDQNGVMNVQPKFVSWSLVSQQNLVDKNCRLGNISSVIEE